MAELMLSVTGANKYLQPKPEITASVKALKITSKAVYLQKFYLYSKMALVIVVIYLFCLLSILSEATSETKLLRDGRYIGRPELGEGSKQAELDVTLKSNEESSVEDNVLLRRIILEVGERGYSKEEITQLFEEGKAYLSDHVLGGNESADAIEQDLIFCETIPNTGIDVDWKPENNELILRDGKIQNDNLTEAIRTTVTAELSYEDQKTYLSMSFQIMPRVISDAEQLDQRLTEELLEAQEKSRRERDLTLPDQLDQYSLSWEEEKGSNGLYVLFLGILAAVAIWYVKDMELRQKMKRRRDQLLMDYPELINKFTLLVNAGMTVRQAWFKIAEDYRAKQTKGESKQHYAYEEMLSTVHELQLGISENTAYEQFGRRIGIIPYIKFSSLISQNLKKGNRGFTDLLRRESMEAFEDRKEMAKRLGEEAGTKLLAPMMFLLVIVFLIIMIPAFMAFQI
jgi:hypothetical protein